MHQDGEVADASARDFDLDDYGAGGFPTLGGSLALLFVQSSGSFFLLCSIDLRPSCVAGNTNKAPTPGQAFPCAGDAAHQSSA
jgi:hypothetical protein